MRKKAIVFFIMMFCWLSATAQSADERSVKRNPATGTAGAEQRVALLIGNASYAGEDRLENPVNDVEDYGKALKSAGFTVTVKKNLKRDELFGAVRDFGRQVAEMDGIALLHYAGHGVAVDGQNYMVPIGAATNQEDSQLINDGLLVDNLVKMLGTRSGRVNVVILDMCRSLPGRGLRGGGGGLAPMKPASGGTLLAFSTRYGTPAGDGPGQRNSPYARQLIAALGQQDLTITDYFNVVRAGVRQATANRQVPVEESTLEGRVPLLIAGSGAVPAVSNSPSGATVRDDRRQGQIDAEEEYWLAIKDSSSLGDFERYKKEYPNGRFAKVAALKADKLRQQAAAPQAPAKPAAAASSSPPAMSAGSSSATPPSTYTDPTTGMEFVFVPGGEFMMGSDDKDAEIDEKPVHRVKVSGLYLGKYEVTQGEWEKVMGTNPSKYKKGPRYPVERVNWDDVQEFVKKLNTKSGKQYRLPTEAEWEYAAS